MRNYMFLTDVANSLCGEDHIIKGISVYTNSADPKSKMEQSQNSSRSAGYGGSNNNSRSSYGGSNSMRQSYGNHMGNGSHRGQHMPDHWSSQGSGSSRGYGEGNDSYSSSSYTHGDTYSGNIN